MMGFRFAIGGCAAVALGAIFAVDLPPGDRWRSIAAFALGGLFIWLGIYGKREPDDD